MTDLTTIDRARIARAGGMRGLAGDVSFAGLGGVVSAGAALLLLLVVARTLGAAGTGIFSVAVAAAMIGVAATKWGLDTTLVHVVPRLESLGGRGQLHALVAASLVRVAVLGCAACLGLVLASSWLSSWMLDGAHGAALAGALQAAAVCLPAAAASLVILSTQRALGEVRPLVVWDQLVKPLGRLVIVGGVLMAGGGVVAALWAWSAVQWIVLIGTLWQGRHLLRSPSRGLPRSPELLRVVSTYSRARLASSLVEMVGMNVAVLVVGAFGTASDAGVIGVAARAVLAGALALQAARIATAPRISAALARDDRRSATRLHLVSTSWVVLVAWPLYAVLVLASPQLMSWFGDGFRQGALVLSVLAIGGMVSVGVGNVQTVLLMSGRADVYLAVSVGSLVTQAVLAMLLVRPYGALGVAVAAAAATCCENLAIAWWVSRRTRVTAVGAPVTTAMAICLIGIAALALGLLFVPDTVTGLLLACTFALAWHLLAILAWVRRARRSPLVDVSTHVPAATEVQ